jgi:hypothetical protein
MKQGTVGKVHGFQEEDLDAIRPARPFFSENFLYLAFKTVPFDRV